jgi:hypothetical protein
MGHMEAASQAPLLFVDTQLSRRYRHEQGSARTGLRPYCEAPYSLAGVWALLYYAN